MTNFELPMSPWRLIPCLEASGVVQMAIDRWLLQQHRQGNSPPILRFYTWSPAAISLGYHQRHYPPFWQQLTWQGQPLEIVRRPTGGRAVLHQGDLTYMVIVSGLPGRKIEVYKRICQFLIEGWRSLGVDLHYGKDRREYLHYPNCFATATTADLIDDRGHKLIGSAQLRQGDATLQHGSLLLAPDPDLFAKVFPNFVPQPLQLGQENSQQNLTKCAIETLTAAASRCFGADFISQPLSVKEWQAIGEAGEAREAGERNPKKLTSKTCPDC